MTDNNKTVIIYIHGQGENAAESEHYIALFPKCSAKFTVMDGGEHWFHTEEQMHFLDEWISHPIH